MKELTIQEIQKLNDIKKTVFVETSNRNPAHFRYLSTNCLVNDRYLLSDPMSNTYVQLVNNDGTLDIISQYTKTKNLTVDGISTFSGNANIKSDLGVKGAIATSSLTVTNNLIVNGQLHTKKAIVDVLEIGDNLMGSGNILNVGCGCTNVINIGSNVRKSEINIGRHMEDSVINIGSIGNVVNIYGTMNYIDVNYTKLNNKEFILNSVSGDTMLLPTKDVGIYLSNGLDDKAGYLKTDSITGDSFVFKAPSCQYELSTPKLNSNSTILVKDETNGLQIESLKASTIGVTSIFVSDVLEIGDKFKINEESISVNSNISSSGSMELRGPLVVHGTTHLENNTVINNTLDVLNLNIQNDLNILGNVSMNHCNINELTVKKDVSVLNNGYIGGNLGVLGDIQCVSLGVNDQLLVATSGVKINQLELNFLEVTNSAFIRTLEVDTIRVQKPIELHEANIKNTMNIEKGIVVGDVANVNILNVSGNANFNSQSVVIDGGLKVNKRGVIVNGVSVFSDVVNVKQGLQISNGGIRAEGNVTFNNAIIGISGSMELLGNATITGSLNVYNQVIIGDDLNVLGSSKMKHIDIYENAYIGGGLTMGSNLDVGGALVVEKESKLLNNIYISGNVGISGNLEIDRMVQIGKTLNVTGDSNFSNNVNIKGILKIGQELRASSRLSVNDNVLIDYHKMNIRSPVYCTDTIHVNKSIYTNESLNVLRDIEVGSNAIVKGDLSSKNSTVNGNLKVHGDFSISSNVGISGNLVVDSEKGGFFMKDKISISDSLLCLVDAKMKSIDISGDSTFGSNVAISKSLNVSEDSYFDNDLTIHKSLHIDEGLDVDRINTNSIHTKSLEISENQVIGRNQRVLGDIEVGGDVHIKGSLKINNAIRVKEDSIEINEKPLATRDFVIGQNPKHILLTLDDQTIQQEYIEDGVYTYLVNDQKLNHFEPLGEGVNGIVNCIVEDLDNNIYVGGNFKTIGKDKIVSHYLAKWNRKTNTWESFGESISGQVQALLVNSKNEVFIAGIFLGGTNLLKYNTTENTFSPIEGMNVFIKTLGVDSDDNIYIAGLFEKVNGIVVNNICRMNSETGRIQTVGSGLKGVISNIVIDRKDTIYAIGGFKYVYRYLVEAGEWAPLDKNPNNTVFCMALNSKDQLYLGGRFTGIEYGIEARSIVKYDPSSNLWEALGEGLYPDIKSIVIDSYNTVYACNNTKESLYRWEESSRKWEYCDVGINGQILAAMFDSYDYLYLGGDYIAPLGKISRLTSTCSKTVKFYNTLKYIDENRAHHIRKLRFTTLGETVTITFKRGIGYTLFNKKTLL